MEWELIDGARTLKSKHDNAFVYTLQVLGPRTVENKNNLESRLRTRKFSKVRKTVPLYRLTENISKVLLKQNL